MDFSRFLDSFVSFAQNHVIIVILIMLGFLFFLVRKPKLFFGLLSLGLLLAGLVYLIMNISGPGLEQKKKMIHEEEEQFDTDR